MGLKRPNIIYIIQISQCQTVIVTCLILWLAHRSFWILYLIIISCSCSLRCPLSCWSCCEIMYSNRSEYSHSRQHSDRSSRQWDGYDDKWERREPHRDIQRDSHHKYGGDGHGSTERTSRGREYSNSPKRLYSKDPLNRDRSRRSPVRRRMSSSDRGTSEKKRQRFTEGCEDQYSYRRVSEDKASRRSPDSFSRTRVTTDFKHTLPQEEAVSYRKPSQDSRHRYRQEEFSFRQQHDDSTGRRSSGYYKDRDGDERSWDRSPERTRSQDCSTKVSYCKHCVLGSV